MAQQQQLIIPAKVPHQLAMASKVQTTPSTCLGVLTNRQPWCLTRVCLEFHVAPSKQHQSRRQKLPQVRPNSDRDCTCTGISISVCFPRGPHHSDCLARLRWKPIGARCAPNAFCMNDYLTRTPYPLSTPSGLHTTGEKMQPGSRSLLFHQCTVFKYIPVEHGAFAIRIHLPRAMKCFQLPRATPPRLAAQHLD